MPDYDYDEFDRREREYQENRANEEGNTDDDGLSFQNEEENEESLSTTWDD